MAALNANAYYQANQVTTVSPGQLLLLVYDGLLRFLAEARRAMAAKKYEAQNTNLLKAQDLLVELICTLDHSVSPELANNLERLYWFMHERLVWANVHDDEQALMDVARMLGELREAWADAERQLRCPNSSTTAAANGVG